MQPTIVIRRQSDRVPVSDYSTADVKRLTVASRGSNMPAAPLGRRMIAVQFRQSSLSTRCCQPYDASLLQSICNEGERQQLQHISQVHQLIKLACALQGRCKCAAGHVLLGMLARQGHQKVVWRRTMCQSTTAWKRAAIC